MLNPGDRNQLIRITHLAPKLRVVWARVPGDIVFGIGALAFAAFVVLAFANARKPAASDA